MNDDDSDKSFSSCTADDPLVLHEDAEGKEESNVISDPGSVMTEVTIDKDEVPAVVSASPPECDELKAQDPDDSGSLKQSESLSETVPVEKLEDVPPSSEPERTRPADESTESPLNGSINNEYNISRQRLDSSSKTAAISNGLILPSAEARSAVLNQLRAYEAKRRPYYQSKLASSLIYWRSVCELMAQSLEETERIESLILGNIEMQKNIAEHCQGVVEDRIDVDGKLLDSKKAKRLQEEKKSRYHNLATFWKSNSDQTILTKLLGFTQPLTPASQAASDEQKKISHHSSILGSVLDFHTSTADRFAENSAILREEAWLPLMTLRSKLEEQISLMEKMGGVIMTQLQSAENTIQHSWCM